MNLKQALDNVTTITSGPALDIQMPGAKDEIVAQVDIQGGSATVSILGRITKNLPFVQIASITASGVYPLASVGEIRMDVTAIAGATVKAYVRVR